MRILLFSPYRLSAFDGKQGNYGAGWINAFIQAIRQYAPDVVLGVSLECRSAHSYVWGKEDNGIYFYPLTNFSSRYSVLRKNLSFEYESLGLIPEIRKVIEDFKPDVIQVFGSETAVGVVCGLTDVPVAVHIQGFLPSYENAKYPPGMSWKDDLPSFWRHPFWHFWRKHLIRIYHKRAEREKEFLSKCQMVFGRTHWDKAIARLYAPQAQYHYVSEVLREEFYENAGAWEKHNHEDGSPFTIVSVISQPLFKGPDVILKTACLLAEHTRIPFRWKVYGIPWDLDGIGRRYRIDAEKCHVESCGIATPKQLVYALREADVFVLPSYIENSPNSLCEAQMLGVPCVATNVGGVASLIQDGENGLLVPANDPVKMSEAILRICNDNVFACTLGRGSAATAQKRHDRKRIVHDALNGYRKMIDMVFN